MVKRHRFLILATAFLIVSCVFTFPAMAFKDYKGKVIDADTKEPIEGAVVTAVWERLVKYFPSGSKGIFKKARETLTDKNGEFSIKPYHHYSLRPFSELRLEWVIFKPGYASFPQACHTYRWHPKVKPRRNLNKIFRPYTVVELPRLKTKEDRLKYLIAPPGPSVPDEKLPLLIRAINIEAVELGLRPTHTEEPTK